MLNRIERLASGRNVILALLAMLVGGALLFNLGPYAEVVSINTRSTVPEETFAPGNGLGAFLEGLGESGRRVYLRHLVLDFLNPLLMGSFFALLLTWTGKLSRLPVYPLVLVLPLLIVLAETVENILLMLATISFPGEATGIGILTAATFMKFISLGLSALVSALLALIALLRRLVGR